MKKERKRKKRRKKKDNEKRKKKEKEKERKKERKKERRGIDRNYAHSTLPLRQIVNEDEATLKIIYCADWQSEH